MQAITVWLDDDLHAALKRFVAETGNIVSHEEALRAAFRDWALSHGYLRNDMEEETPPQGNA
jgi:predicted transcriptional regulator